MSGDIKTLVGRTLHAVTVNRDDESPDDSIVFTTTTGERWRLHHEQDCCESVTIEDVIGDVSDLVGHEILVAEERSDDDYVDKQKFVAESETWTFYELRTVVGSVTIRWYGESNGYYSESVGFDALDPHEPADADTWVVAGDQVLAAGETSVAARYVAYFKLGGA